MNPFGNWVSWGFDELSGWATGAAADIAQNVFASLAGWIIGPIADMMALAMTFALSNDGIAEGCTIDGVAECSRAAFVFDTFDRSRTVAAGMAVIFLVWGIGRAALTGDVGAVMRKFFLEAPKAVLLSALDAISNELLDPVFRDDRDQYMAGFQRFDDLSAGEGAGASFVMVILGLVVLIGSVFLWMLMMFRTVAISVLVTLAPLVAVLGVTSYAGSMQKLMRMLMALIASKIVIVLTLSLGVSVIMNTAVLRAGLDQTAVVAVAPAAPGELPPDPVALQDLGDGQAVAAAYQMGTGALVVLLALFSPMVIMQLIPDSVEQYYMFGDLDRRQGSTIRRSKRGMAAARSRVGGRSGVRRLARP